MAERKYRWLLFDADNTLFDFDASERAAFTEALQKLHVTGTPALYERYHRINAVCWAKLEQGLTDAASLREQRFRLLLQEWEPEDPSVTASLLTRTYEPLLGQQAILYPDAASAVRTLARSHTLLLLTNGTAAVQRRRWERAGLWQFFKSVYISEEIGCRKPESAFFEFVLRQEQVQNRADCLMIGDSLTSDMDGALGAGIDCCWVNRSSAGSGGRSLTYQVSSLTELCQLLEGDCS